MASYPGSVATLTNPTTSDPLNSPSHAGQHEDANDEIEAIETELGTDVAMGSTDLKTYLSVAHETTGLHKDFAQTIVPSADGTYDSGSTAKRWANVHLDNLKFADGTTMTTAAAASTGVSAAGDLNIASDSDASAAGDIIIATSTVEAARFLADTQSFGIGTATPTAAIGIKQAGNDGGVEVDNDGTGSGLYLHQDGITAASKYGLWVYSNAAQTNTPLVFVEQDNGSSDQNAIDIQNDGTGAGLWIDQNGESEALTIDTEVTTADGMSIAADALTDGGALTVSSASADASARNIVSIINDNAAATDTVPLYIQNDSGDTNWTGIGIGNGAFTPVVALHIAHGENAYPGINIDSFDSDAGYGPVIKLRKSHNNTLGTVTATTDTENLGKILFFGVDSAPGWSYGAKIEARQDGAATATTAPTNLVFETSGTAINTSQFVLHNSGNIGMGILAPTATVLHIYSNSADTTSRNVVEMVNDNAAADDAVVLKLQQDGDDNQIIGTGDEHLTAAGAWVDRSCCHADKTEVAEITNTKPFSQKLKNLKLFEYKVKREVYGVQDDILEEVSKNEAVETSEDIDEEGAQSVTETTKAGYIQKDDKYYKKVGKGDFPAKVKYADARVYKGYILDDPSTPEELIAKDLKGNVGGKSAADGVNFLLGVCKELQEEIEALKHA